MLKRAEGFQLLLSTYVLILIEVPTVIYARLVNVTSVTHKHQYNIAHVISYFMCHDINRVFSDLQINKRSGCFPTDLIVILCYGAACCAMLILLIMILTFVRRVQYFCPGVDVPSKQNLLANSFDGIPFII